jgi:hypothetical protein
MSIRHMAVLLGAAAATIALTGTSALAAPRPAATVWHATASPDVYYSCSGTPFTSGRECKLKLKYNGTPVFNPGGSIAFTAPAGDIARVTCYYYGNPPSPWKTDGIEDHINYLSTDTTFVGHIPDYYVDEGGEVPYDSPYDLSECS